MLICNFRIRTHIDAFVSSVRASVPTSGQASLAAQNRHYAPIIIIGMHRSGTTLLSRLLESLGLFLGRQKDENHESHFFQDINEWLFRQAGAAWDNPAAMRYLLQNPEQRGNAASYIREYLLPSPRAISFLGWSNYLRRLRISAMPHPWGWKDPRNTFTLPVWLEIFPNAKVLHLHRSGMDVALSLRRRGRREGRLQHLYRALPALHWLRPKRGGFVHSLRCDHLEGGLALWREYLDQATDHVAVSRDRAMEVSFENLIRNPATTLRALCEFCDLPFDTSAIAYATSIINPGVLTSVPGPQLCEEVPTVQNG